MAMGTGFRSSLEGRLAAYSMDKLKARYLAKAGIVKAKAYIAAKTRSYDSLYQRGIEVGDQLPENIFSGQLGRGSFTYEIADEESKININLSKFPGDKEKFKKALGSLSSDFSESIINSIIDWQDTDSQLSSPGGAESSFYEFLDNPYQCRNLDFKTIEELLLVKGLTPTLLKQLETDITVYGEGKININTASSKVLNAIINDETGSFGGLIDKIILFRKGPDTEEATADDGYFTTIEDVKLLAQDNQEISRLNYLRNYFIFKSYNFKVVSRGKINKLTKPISCVLTKQPHLVAVKVAYYHED